MRPLRRYSHWVDPVRATSYGKSRMKPTESHIAVAPIGPNRHLPQGVLKAV